MIASADISTIIAIAITITITITITIAQSTAVSRMSYCSMVTQRSAWFVCVFELFDLAESAYCFKVTGLYSSSHDDWPVAK